MVNFWIVRSGRDRILQNQFLDEDRMAIGLGGTTDFEQIYLKGGNIAIRDHILNTHEGGEPNKPTYKKGRADYGVKFFSDVKFGDVVFLSGKGASVVALGKVVGDYYFDAAFGKIHGRTGYHHTRGVDWTSFGEPIEVRGLPSTSGFSRVENLNADNVMTQLETKSSEMPETLTVSAKTDSSPIHDASSPSESDGTIPRLIRQSIKFAVRLVKERIGQEKFRKEIIEVWSGECAITGCDVSEALEACHVVPVSESGQSDYTNGILLRRDLHRLFDENIIGFSSDGSLKIALNLKHYRQFHGIKISKPSKFTQAEWDEFIRNLSRRT
jgi:hypothetical protein